jgi:hypothetical protein
MGVAENSSLMMMVNLRRLDYHEEQPKGPTW